MSTVDYLIALARVFVRAQLPGYCGVVSTEVPTLAECIRVLRVASRDHMGRDTLSEATNYNYIGQWDGPDGWETLRHKMWSMRSDRDERRGGNFPMPVALPWQACKVVGVMQPDPICPGDKYVLVVAYTAKGTNGALAAYGIPADGSAPHCYWN